jgi:adenosylmethionine-8-amino-7-oxononanoate aminotransferase
MTDPLTTDKANIWHPFTPLAGVDAPLLITHAEGIYLCTADGRKIIDGISSWWVNLHGHANPKIAKAVAEQAAKLEHVIFAGFTHEPAIKLSENLLSVLPGNFSKIFFSDNGSTSVEVALKIAMQFWHNKGIDRKKIIAIEGAYHGDTFGSMSVGDRSIFSDPFSPYLFQVEFIEFPSNEKEHEVFVQFTKLIEQGNVGAFIYEPLIQAAGGMRTYSSELLNKLIKFAQQHEVVCIADEVFTGFGRTGKMFASDYQQHKPDLIALSKGLTGGTLPLGVTAVTSKIVSAFETTDFTKTFFHGHSFTANPIACAAANASFEILQQKDCWDRILDIEKQHKKISNQLKSHSAVKEIRNLGTILAIELRIQGQSSYSNELRKKIYNYFIEQNILLRPLGNTFYIVAPYCITSGELEHIYNVIREFLSTLE